MPVSSFLNENSKALIPTEQGRLQGRREEIPTIPSIYESSLMSSVFTDSAVKRKVKMSLLLLFGGSKGELHYKQANWLLLTHIPVYYPQKEQRKFASKLIIALPLK